MGESLLTSGVCEAFTDLRSRRGRAAVRHFRVTIVTLLAVPGWSSVADKSRPPIARSNRGGADTVGRRARRSGTRPAPSGWPHRRRRTDDPGRSRPTVLTGSSRGRSCAASLSRMRSARLIPSFVLTVPPGQKNSTHTSPGSGRQVRHLEGPRCRPTHCSTASAGPAHERGSHVDGAGADIGPVVYDSEPHDTPNARPRARRLRGARPLPCLIREPRRPRGATRP